MSEDKHPRPVVRKRAYLPSNRSGTSRMAMDGLPSVLYLLRI